MRLQSCEQGADPLEEAIVDDSFILVCFDFVLALESLLVDLVLLRSDEGSLVDIGLVLYQYISRELGKEEGRTWTSISESSLNSSASWFVVSLEIQPGGVVVVEESRILLLMLSVAYPFTVVESHLEDMLSW